MPAKILLSLDNNRDLDRLGPQDGSTTVRATGASGDRTCRSGSSVLQTAVSSP